uniref:non-specific serine/threonine protein kinase n=1 Tax=Vitis vinifera TaxID=29760 RepID=F6I1Y8_VITVI
MLYNLRLGATWLQDSLGDKEHEESTTNSELQFFDMNTIATATNNFSSKNELGCGGFGSVYKMFLQYLILFLMLPLCSSTDTITPNQPFRDGDLLVSKESRFALGFFSPRNSTLRYIGVWYNTIREQTVVWVLNRDHPINDTSGVLSINTSGNLLLHRGNTHVWSTDVSISSVNPTVAQLLDTGNLVLIQKDDKMVVWQGFDYPTDNLIPHMKLGLNRRTGYNRFLTSWKSPTDPATGKYSLGFNVSGSPQIFLYQGSEPLWRSGHWNGLRWSGLPVMMYRFQHKVSFLNNQDEIYYMFIMVNASFLERLTVDHEGYIQRNMWQETEGKWFSFYTAPRDRCDRYGRCGPNSNCDNSQAEFECTCLAGFEPKSPRDLFLKDGSAGCLRKEGAKVCGNGEGFVKVGGAKPPDTSVARVNMNISMEACREECLKECSCSGYAAANVSGSGSGCLSWHGDLVDTRVFPEGGQNLYVRVDAITLGRGRQNKMLYNSRPGATWLQDSPGAKEHDESTTNSELQFFDLNTIVAATNNFSSENELGRGGFGSVFKGQLSNGQEIAVKKLSKDSGQGKEEFKNEATLIAKLQHVNLVRLVGCCITEEENMLVYEYLSNKSLDSFIFDETKKSLLDWRKRFEIIVGIARGILYLHEDSRLRIIHRDLKASNVLLDAEMFPKISDFGLARIFRGNQMEGNTNRVVGT